jgi:hypothetical protein
LTSTDDISGRYKAAAHAVATLRGRDLAELPRCDIWLVTMNSIVEAAHLLDDPNTSACVYELLSGYAHRPMVGGLGVVCFGSAQQALGVAALTMSRLDRAVEHLRAAVHDNLALGHWPALVASRVRLAQALGRRGRHGDADAARRAVDAARRETGALGITVAPYVAGSAAACGPATCVREGRLWRVEHEYRSVLVPHSVGMLHLAVLLANPGDEIPCVDLAAGVANLRTLGATSTQPVLDQVAIRQYRNRLAGLDDDSDASQRTERDWLLAQLAAAKGFNGRIRTFSQRPGTGQTGRHPGDPPFHHLCHAPRRANRRAPAPQHPNRRTLLVPTHLTTPALSGSCEVPRFTEDLAEQPDMPPWLLD